MCVIIAFSVLEYAYAGNGDSCAMLASEWSNPVRNDKAHPLDPRTNFTASTITPTPFDELSA